MASRNNRKRISDRTEKYALVQVRFTDLQKRDCNAWVDQRDLDIANWLAQVTERGWKWSISYSDYYQCYFSTVTCKECETEQGNLSYSLRHTDIEKVIGITMWFVDELMESAGYRVPLSGDEESW